MWSSDTKSSWEMLRRSSLRWWETWDSATSDMNLFLFKSARFTPRGRNLNGSRLSRRCSSFDPVVSKLFYLSIEDLALWLVDTIWTIYCRWREKRRTISRSIISSYLKFVNMECRMLFLSSFKRWDLKGFFNC